MSQGRAGRPFLVKSVTVTVDGVTHQGIYYVQGSEVHVRSPLGEKITQIGESSPEALAKLLLWKLVHDKADTRSAGSERLKNPHYFDRYHRRSVAVRLANLFVSYRI